MDLDGLATGGAVVALGTAANWLYGVYQKKRELDSQARLRETADQKAEREAQEEAQRRHREAVIAGYEDLLLKAKDDIRELKAGLAAAFRELSAARDDRERCERLGARRDERIAWMADAMRQHGIPVPQWNPDGGGTDTHTPLPPDAGPVRPHGPTDEGDA